MVGEIFIDTSGFYALLVRGDDQHDRARHAMRQAAKKKQRFVTTGYVLPEPPQNLSTVLFKSPPPHAPRINSEFLL